MSVDAESKSFYKIQYLRDFLNSYDTYIPIICITETWLKTYSSGAQVKLPSYIPYRSDRESRTRGGCITYVHDIAVGEVLRFDNQYCEVVITPLEKVSTAIITVYRPGNAPLSKFTAAMNFIQDFVTSVNDSWTFMINGDFNFPNINWQTSSVVSGLSSNENACANLLLSFLERNGMSQYIDVPTRREPNGTANILELLITNSSEIVLDVRSEETMISDHDWVTISLGTDFSPSKPSNAPVVRPFGFSWFNFNQADFKRMNSYIKNTPWNDMFLQDPNSFGDTFERTLMNICHLCVPLKKSFTETSIKEIHKKPSHISGLKRKQKILRCRIKAMQAGNPNSYRISFLKSKLDNINACIKSKLSLERSKEEMKAVANIKNNPRFFYSYAKKFSKLKCKIGPLKAEDSQFVSDPEQMANLLQKQFCSVFSDPDSPNKEDPQFSQTSSFLEDINLVLQDICAAIDDMRLHSAPGEDEIPAILFKSCRDSICLPLFIMWNFSFESGEIDQKYLSQLIAPIFKGGSKLQPSNYRPVSLTSHVIKIFERVIQKKMIKYIEESHLLSCNQHGFRKGRSCLSELLAHFDLLYENLGNSLDSDTVYLDFSKAFDKVDHALLIKKLQLYGIKGKLLNWIKSFLSDRVQKVVIDGKMSLPELVISGVPQGTVLGPLLFLLFVNDLEKCIKYSKLKLFADDSRLIKSVHPTLGSEDKLQLQHDINAVLQWAETNNMVLNETKFKLLCHHVHAFAPNNNMRLLQQLPFSLCQYERSYWLPGSITLNRSDFLDDLGICVTDDFSFQFHINQIAKKGNMKVSWILSVFKSRDAVTMLTLFKSLVLNVLEYCCPLWLPHRVQDITKLEAVQRRFTSKIYSVRHQDYWSRLKTLNLYSLQRRRERYQLIYLWKIINNKVPNDIGINSHVHIRRGIVVDIPRLPSPVAKINSAFDNCFNIKAANTWNCLPKHVNRKASL